MGKWARYEPKPIDVSHVELPRSLDRLTDRLAENNHDIWARDRFAKDWQWGPKRDESVLAHPDLVPYAELPEEEKDYDRRSVQGTLKAVLSCGYAIVESPRNGSDASEAGDESSVRQVLDRITGWQHANGSLLDLWRSHDPRIWQQDRQTYLLFAKAARSAGETLLAYDVARVGLAAFGGDLQLAQVEALSLADLGCHDEGRQRLEALAVRFPNDVETMGLLARVYKDLGLAAKPARRGALLQKALALYGQAAAAGESYWNAVNAAALALVLERRRDARRRAVDTRGLCLRHMADEAPDQPAADRYWVRATLGEVALIEGKMEEACRWYEEAVACAPGAHGMVVSSRKNARLIADHLGMRWEPIAQALRLPSITVFTGHMVDRPGRPQPRYPPELVPRVQAAIECELSSIGPTIGYASAAGGGDIQFLQALRQLGNSGVVVLPYPPSIFCMDSVDIVPGAQWRERFDSVLGWATVLPPIASQSLSWGGVEYLYANAVLLGLAKLKAQYFETDLVGLALWDGRPGDGKGGTASTVALWNRHSVPWKWIDVTQLRTDQPGTPSRRPVPRDGAGRPRAGAATVRALLFADLQNYSRLKDSMVRPFLRHVFGLAARVARRPARRFLAAESRGDGFYLTFRTAAAAARFALGLRESLIATDWRAKGLPETLAMRIALHAGPLHHVRDPLTRRMSFTGTHVIKAARIEPKAPANEVWVSQEFAALAALENARDFSCLYVGEVPLDKNFGIFPMYRLTAASSRGTASRGRRQTRASSSTVK